MVTCVLAVAALCTPLVAGRASADSSVAAGASADAWAQWLRAEYAIDYLRLSADDDGVPNGGVHITGRLTDPLPNLDSDPRRNAAAYRGAALGLLRGLRGLFYLPDVSAQSVQEESLLLDRHGRTHIAYRRYAAGLPLVGGEILVHVEPDGVVSAVNGNALRLPEAFATGDAAHAAAQAITEGDARRATLDQLGRQGFPPSAVRSLTLRKLAVAGRPYVVWQADAILHSGSGRWSYTIDGRTGKILRSLNNLQSAPEIGTGIGVLGNTQDHIDTFSSAGAYLLEDVSRRADTDPHGHGGQMSPNASIETSDPAGVMTDADNAWDASDQAAGVDAHVFAAQTYDYWLAEHALNSFDYLGSSMFSLANSDTGFCQGVDNAYWDGTGVTYCLGFFALPLSGTLDVVAHEWGHAVTELAPGARRSQLIYAGYAGALNESFSDCMGTTVEHYYGEFNWVIGDDIFAIRDMQDPNVFEDPAYVGDPYWNPVEGCTPTSSNDNCYVHSNSGVPNKMFYLLTAGTGGEPGGTFNGVEVQGLGIFDAMAVLFDANVFYWVADETFEGARDGMMSAAAPYGANAVTQVQNAWAAVGVGQPSFPGAQVVHDSNGAPVELCGDGDADVEPGEQWRVPVTLRNRGDDPATNIVANFALGAGVNDVTLLTPSVAYPDLASGAQATANLDFRIESAFAPCGANVAFDIAAITYAEGTTEALANAVVVATGGGDGAIVYFSEDFESAASFATWTVTTGPGLHTGGAWARIPDHLYARPPGSTGYFAIADSDAAGPASYTSTILTSPPIDLSGVVAGPVTLDVDVTFLYWILGGLEHGHIQVSNDGVNWINLVTYDGADFLGHESLDVTPYAVGSSNFRVRFSYQDAQWDFWFAVDNVRVTAPVSPVCDSGGCGGCALALAPLSDVTAECAGPAGTSVSLTPPTVLDSCGAVNMSNDAPALFPPGGTLVTWTATDDAGNTATVTQTVAVQDTTPPTITAPADVSASTTDPAGTPVDPGSATAADGCGGVTVTNDAPSVFPIGTTTVTWTATDDAGLQATDTQRVDVTLSGGGPEPVDDVAQSDVAVAGTVTGAYPDTWAADGMLETITERDSGGKPANRYSFLEHKWTFDVTGGDAVTFFLRAFRSDSGEGDAFTFAYSLNDQDYTDMVTVTKTADDGVAEAFAMPADTVGTVYVRVMDTDRTPGNRTQDTVSIDAMYLRSEGAGSGIPPAAPSGLSATAVSASRIDLLWTDNAVDEYGFEIERSDDSGASWILVANVGADTQAFSDSGLLPNSTYDYRVRAFNGVGTSAYTGPVSATTQQGIAITSVNGYKAKGVHTVELTWVGATSVNVDIVRDGVVVATVPNSGAYTDSTGGKGGATYTYEVCEAGTSGCSDPVMVAF